MVKKVYVRLMAAALVGLSLAACNALDTGAKKIQASCVAATEAYRALTPQVPKLSTDRLVQVKTVKDMIIDPICGAEGQPEYSDLLIGRLQDATQILINADQGVK